MITFTEDINLTNDAAHFYIDLAEIEKIKVTDIFEDILENYYAFNKGEED